MKTLDRPTGIAIYMNCRHFFLLMLLPSGIAVGADVWAQTVVYKQVDATGRVTYSNQPMKGGVIVDLSPLTVLPKSQTAVAARSTVASQEANPQPTVAAEPSQQLQPRQAVESSATDASGAGQPAAPALGRASATPQVAIVTSRPPQEESLRQVAPSGAGTSAALMAKQRREDVRRRILEGEIEAESQLLSEAQSDLQREQTKTNAMRSLRAALLADERTIAGKRTQNEDSANTIVVIERHFERIRELQDQVSMHEENLNELRSQLRTQPAAQTIRSAQLRPVAATKARQSAPVRR